MEFSNNNNAMECPFDMLIDDMVCQVISTTAHESWFNVMLVNKKWYAFGSYVLKPTKEHMERAIKACYNDEVPKVESRHKLQIILDRYHKNDVASYLKLAIESRRATEILLSSHYTIITPTIIEEYIDTLMATCNKNVKRSYLMRDHRVKQNTSRMDAAQLVLHNARMQCDVHYRRLLDGSEVKRDVGIMFVYLSDGGEYRRNGGIEAMLSDVRVLTVIGTDLMWQITTMCAYRRGPKRRIAASINTLFQIMPEYMLMHMQNRDRFVERLYEILFFMPSSTNPKVLKVHNYPMAVLYFFQLQESRNVTISGWIIWYSLRMACECGADYLVEWILSHHEEVPRDNKNTFYGMIEVLTQTAPKSIGLDTVLDHYPIKLNKYLSTKTIGQRVEKSVVRLLKNKLIFAQLTNNTLLKNILERYQEILEHITESEYVSDYPGIRMMALALHTSEDESFIHRTKRRALGLFY
jgi:23S rRNA A2030 N6-methylase RlmJ